MTGGALRRLLVAGACAAAIAGLALGPSPAQARVHVGIGFGFGVPVYPAPYYYPPPPVYYPPPPVYYGPPAVTYVPAPQQPSPQASGECREYTSTSTIDGVPQKTYGTACRQPDGSWRIVE